MNVADIARYAYAAGFRGRDLLTAVAIALGESGGNPDAAGDVGLQTKTWGPSIGLWQIRSIKGQTGTGGARDASQLRDPAFNARSAYHLFTARGSFRDWTVYKKGIYKRYLSQARQAIDSLGDKIGALPVGTDLSLLDDEEAGTSEEEVRMIYRELQGRDPTEDELRHWLGMPDTSDIKNERETKSFTAAKAAMSFAQQAGSI